MFTFNFGSNKTEESNSSDEESEIANRINPTEISEVPHVTENYCFALKEGITINSLSKENLICLLENDNDLSIQKAETSHSDLLPGIYEGGLKIWECTYDLCEYILNNNKLSFEGKVVLDLGCGAGILGILAKKLGAMRVDFQDYNSGVLKNLTIPNMHLNFTSLENVGFWSGDWSGFTQNNVYDVILTSETIYNTKNYSKLHKLFKENLKPDGIVFLAAKSYYFGVGGSTSEFCDFIEKKNIFTFQKVFSVEEGVKRAVLELRFKHHC